MADFFEAERRREEAGIKPDEKQVAAERAEFVDPKLRLMNACEIGDSDRVFLTLKKAEDQEDQSIFNSVSVGALVESTTKDGVTPLFAAVKAGNVECAKILLQYGATPNKPIKSGKFTPLWIACQKGHERCVKLLLEQREVLIGGLNQRAADGRTPLYAACESGSVACVKLLMEQSARLELRRNDDSTPLIVASVFGHADVVELLLEAGAKLKPKDEDGTALENARKQTGAGKREEVIALLEEALAKRGKDEEDDDGQLIRDGGD